MSSFTLFEEVDRTRHERLCVSSDWYTPSKIVEAAREVLGGIDLDPASCEAANRVVGAAKIYTIDDDGLAESNDWRGRIFLNPPSPPGPWWKRLIEEREAERVTAAIYVAYSIEQLQQLQAWTPHAPLSAHPICIPRRRVRYMQESEQLGIDGVRALVPGAQPTHASAIVGIGVDAGCFRRAFAEIGLCR